jgi:hypothetical protein
MASENALLRPQNMNIDNELPKVILSPNLESFVFIPWIDNNIFAMTRTGTI